MTANLVLSIRWGLTAISTTIALVLNNESCDENRIKKEKKNVWSIVKYGI